MILIRVHVFPMTYSMTSVLVMTCAYRSASIVEVSVNMHFCRQFVFPLPPIRPKRHSQGVQEYNYRSVQKLCPQSLLPPVPMPLCSYFPPKTSLPRADSSAAPPLSLMISGLTLLRRFLLRRDTLLHTLHVYWQ